MGFFLNISYDLETKYYDKQYYCCKRDRIQFVRPTHDSLTYNVKFYKALVHLDGPHKYPMMETDL